VGDFLRASQLFIEASNSLNDFRRVNTNEGTAQSLTNVEDPITWKKPPTCMIKVNWDAAINKTHGRIIVWDHEGIVLVACSIIKIFLVEACVTETLVVVHAVEFCKEVGFFSRYYARRRYFTGCRYN
jgi:hypothetical protein